MSGIDEPVAPPGAQAIDWPRCAYCSSVTLHESSRGGVRERLLRLCGASLLRCESCGRRFAFAALGHPSRHRLGSSHANHTRAQRAASEPRREKRRHTLVRMLVTLVAALVTFVTAAWLISRAERRGLEGDGIAPPPDPQ